MRRKLFNFAVVASLILFTAVCITWGKSYARGYAVSVSRSDWPSVDQCVYRYLTARLVLGHWVVSWAHYKYDLTIPNVTTFHHAMDLPTFRTKYAPGIRWDHFVYDIRLGPQSSMVAGGNSYKLNIGREGYFLQVPMRYGFGSKNDPARTYMGRTDVEHYAVAPAWLTGLALALLPILWVLQYARRGRRLQMGRCPICGYDLRASPERCPECGEPAGQPAAA